MRVLATGVLAAALALSACADVGDAPAATTTEGDSTATVETPTPTGTPLAVDTSQSSVEWTAAKPTRTHEGGFHAFTGTVYLDGDQVTGAEVTAQSASIYSDVERLTEHLHSADFFDVAQFPEVRFVVSSLTPLAAADTAGTNGATHTAEGTITMHGQTNSVSFPIAVSVEGETVTADADFTIDRRDWGLIYPGQPDDLIQDEVRLRLHIVAPGGAADAAAGTDAGADSAGVSAP